MRKKLQLDPEVPYVLFVGSLEEVKGIETLLQAVCILIKEEAMKFKLLIAGSGSLKTRIEEYIHQNNLEDFVILLGSVSHEKIAEYMNASNLFCLPSIREGHPNVVNEALASGIPVVGTNVGAIPDLLNDTTGIVVPPSEPKLLAKGLRVALSSDWDTNAIRNEVADCSWLKCAQRYAGVLESTIQ